MRIFFTTLSLCPIIFLSLVISQTPSNSFDGYGGYKNIQGKPTGRFQLTMIKGRHFLVTPEGHGFISLGVTHTSSVLNAQSQKFDIFKETYQSNLIKADKSITHQLTQWGYNSLGYDQISDIKKHAPYFGSCSATTNSLWLRDKKFQYEDVFSQSWKDKASKVIKNMVSKSRDKKNLIGYYWTDMPAWHLKHSKKTLGIHWVDYIRNLPLQSAGKKRYLEFLHNQAGKTDDQKFLVLIAKEYYKTLGELTRKLDPDTLIFGERYNGGALDFDVIQEALPYIDAISIQPTGCTFNAKKFDQLYTFAKKPIMICDHQCSFPTKEYKKTIWKQLASVHEVNRAHNTYLDDAFSKPYLIGYHRCQYIDRVQGIALKQGLVDVKGKPRAELIDNVSKANLKIHQQFLKY